MLWGLPIVIGFFLSPLFDWLLAGALVTMFLYYYFTH